jgi:hypothetical protein
MGALAVSPRSISGLVGKVLVGPFLRKELGQFTCFTFSKGPLGKRDLPFLTKPRIADRLDECKLSLPHLKGAPPHQNPQGNRQLRISTPWIEAISAGEGMAKTVRLGT